MCVFVPLYTRRQYFSTPHHFLFSLPISLPLTADAVPTLYTTLVTDRLVLLSWSLPPLATLPDRISEDDLPRLESRVVVDGYTFSRDRDDMATFLIGRSNTNFLDNTVTGRDTYIYILYVLYADRRIRDNIPVVVELKVDVPSSDGKQQMNSTQ